MPLQATSGAASYDAFGGGVAAVPQYIEDVFSTYLYTGNGTSLTVTNNIDLSTKGGLVWLKSRSTAGTHHTLFDSARGANKFLFTDLTDAQTTDSGQTLNTTGFTIGNNSDINTSAATYASWTFRKQPKFFDVVTYTGNGANPRTITHSLGSAPGCIIFKNTSSADDWYVYHRSLATSKELKLNTTNAQITNTTGKPWNTTPTSTEFYVGGSFGQNITGETYVAYLFAHDAGGFGLTGTDNVISCGSYTGNGSATGPSITLGYEPQWVLVKSSTVAGSHWYLMDTMRGMAQTVCNELYANLDAAEITQSKTIIPTATGFDVATTDSYINNNGSTYIYIAIRRGPMKVPTSGTSVFSPVARSGTGSTSTVSNSITTDLIISMTRNTGQSSGVWDRLRGFAAYLETTGTATESTSSDSVTALNNTSYVLGADTATDRINRSGYTYANWNFRRAPSFFDEVCYTGTGVTHTETHNLGVAPELIIVKRRASATASWAVYAAPLTASYVGFLDLTNAFQADNMWNSTAPTSTAFTVRAANAQVNASGSTYVAYLFATCAGVSKVFSYTGNGSSQTINCGFTAGARWILIKRTDSTGDWYVWDSARGIVSGNDPHLSLNTTAAEVTTDDTIDTDSTGFVVNQVSATNVNVSSATYIGIAIA